MSEIELQNNFWFQKVKYTVEIFNIFYYIYKHLSCSNMIYQPEMNFIEHTYLPCSLISCPVLLHVT